MSAVSIIANPSVKVKTYRPHIPAAIKHEYWSKPCACCGHRKNVHVDHIIPVTWGGSSGRANLQPLCQVCNNTKGNRLTNQQLWDVCVWRLSGFDPGPPPLGEYSQ